MNDNEETIINNMIEFIENEEKEIQAQRLAANKSKVKVVADILKELEVQLKNEN